MICVGGFNTDWCFSKLALLVYHLNWSIRHTQHHSTQFFIELNHQLSHGNTALGLMSIFIMTNGSQFFFLCVIYTNGKINYSYFNTLGGLFWWQVQNSEKRNQIWYNHLFLMSSEISQSLRVFLTRYFTTTPQIHLHTSDNISLYFL